MEAMGNGEAGRAAGKPTLAGKYLTFVLGDEEYGVPVLKAREIIKMMDVTPVPQTPRHVRGVINLRGRVIPVVDLRLKFGLPPREAADRTCIIVVDAELPSGCVRMGVVVDGVSEVLTLSGGEIEEAPTLGDGASHEELLGLAKVKGTVKILLDLDRVLGRDGLVLPRPV